MTTKKTSNGYPTDNYVRDASTIDDAYFEKSLGSGGFEPSNGVRKIKTTREGQVILSQIAMDNVGHGFFEEHGDKFGGRSSINDDHFGTGKIDVKDMTNVDHSIDTTRKGDHRAFGEEALKKVRAVEPRDFSLFSSDKLDRIFGPRQDVESDAD
jgi:hypothetical protein